MKSFQQKAGEFLAKVKGLTYFRGFTQEGAIEAFAAYLDSLEEKEEKKECKEVLEKLLN